MAWRLLVFKTMDIEKTAEQGTTTLRLSGEIDLHASPELRKALHECAEEKVAVLLLDFSGVSYIDSSGLATLIEYVRESADHGGKLGLFGLQTKVRTIFELVRLNELFVIGDSAEATVATLGAA